MTVKTVKRYLMLATGCGDNAVRIFRRETDVVAAGDLAQAPTFTLAAVQREAHTEDVNSVAWHPKEAGLLATCGDEGLVKLWRIVEY